ncbi:MAG: amidohydrolase family protein [Deltaproteobacteria bacterium]|nr:amidohydrolase family protein [Deltaproteobacteria bacterium]MBW2530346.1 amidohydrolase family protein [Deltaproteobacteria bacterium]
MRILCGLVVVALLWLLGASCAASGGDDDDGGGTGGTTSTTVGGAAGTGGDGGAAGAPIEPGPDAEILSVGEPGKVLLRGWVITPGQSFAGEVLIEGNLLTCVAESCGGEAGAATASVIDTHGIIMPGMIDTHNHILFDIFDADDWTPTQAYQNHNQWTNEAGYIAMLDAKQYLNGESGSPVNLNCEMIKYGELKALVAGTTSVAGAANPSNKICYRTVARTIDQTANGLCGTQPPQSCEDHVQVNSVFPSSSAANGVCANFLDGDTEAYFVHVGEGVDDVARYELGDLYGMTTPNGCLHDPRTTIVHGTAFTDTEFDTMANAGMGLSWSPRSNVFLYGSGTDLSKTTNIPLALSKGIRVAISPDWSLGGSPNLLDELHFADRVDSSQWADALTPLMLIEMVTTTPANLLAYDDQIGSLAPGMKADVTVLGGDFDQPYASVIAADPSWVRLVLVDGVALYGDDQLLPIAPSSPGCEQLEVCSREKFLCVAVEGGDPEHKFGQTLADIETALNDALVAYDQLDMSPWDFAPITPLVPPDSCR